MDEINNSKKKSNQNNIEYVFLRNRKKINKSQDKQNYILNIKNPFIKQNNNINNFLIDKKIYKEKIDSNKKTHEDNIHKIKELEKKLNEYSSLNDEMKKENINIKNEIGKIKMEKNQLNKEINLKKELVEKLKQSNIDLNKEKEEFKKHIEKLNQDIIELKTKNNRLNQINKIKSDNSSIPVENIHKLKKTIDSLTKEKNGLEEKYNELLKRIEIKEKTNKVNKALLSKERKITKFENLHRMNSISFTIQRKKKKNKILNLTNNNLVTNNLNLKNSFNISHKKFGSFFSSNKKLNTTYKENQLNNKSMSISHLNTNNKIKNKNKSLTYNNSKISNRKNIDSKIKNNIKK